MRYAFVERTLTFQQPEYPFNDLMEFRVEILRVFPGGTYKLKGWKSDLYEVFIPYKWAAWYDKDAPKALAQRPTCHATFFENHLGFGLDEDAEFDTLDAATEAVVALFQSHFGGRPGSGIAFDGWTITSAPLEERGS